MRQVITEPEGAVRDEGPIKRRSLTFWGVLTRRRLCPFSNGHLFQRSIIKGESVRLFLGAITVAALLFCCGSRAKASLYSLWGTADADAGSLLDHRTKEELPPSTTIFDTASSVGVFEATANAQYGGNLATAALQVYTDAKNDPLYPYPPILYEPAVAFAEVHYEDTLYFRISEGLYVEGIQAVVKGHVSGKITPVGGVGSFQYRFELGKTIRKKKLMPPAR